MAVGVVGLSGVAVVEVGVIGFAAAGQGDVGQVAAGGLSEHGVGGVGGDALGGVHGDGMAELYMVTQVIVAEDGPRAVAEPAGGQAGMLGAVVDFDDLPALPLRTGASSKVWVRSSGCRR